jgi:hypothetical protein
VLVDVEAEHRRDAPDRVGVLRVADVVEELAGVLVDAGPGPAAGGDAGGLEVLLVILERAEIAVDQLGDLSGRLAVAAEDGEVKLVVFQAAESEGEIDLQVADGRGDLVRDRGIGRVGHAEFLDGLEQRVRLVDVARIELHVLLVGLVGDAARLAFDFRKEGGLFVFVFMSHDDFSV